MDVGTPVPTSSSRRHKKGRSSTGDDMKKSNIRRRSGGNPPSPPHRRKSTDTHHHSRKALSRKKYNSQHSLKRASAPITPPNSSDNRPGRSKSLYQNGDNPYQNVAKEVVKVDGRKRRAKSSFLQDRKKLIIVYDHEDIKIPAHSSFTYFHCHIEQVKKVPWKSYDVMLLIVPTKSKKETMLDICKRAKKSNAQLFICIIDVLAGESAVFRYCIPREIPCR